MTVSRQDRIPFFAGGNRREHMRSQRYALCNGIFVIERRVCPAGSRNFPTDFSQVHGDPRGGVAQSKYPKSRHRFVLLFRTLTKPALHSYKRKIPSQVVVPP